MNNKKFDLDVQVLKSSSDVQPEIFSKSLCTPGCDDGTLKTSCCLFACG
ncbi:gallidermin/nisin family lantibiotic [Priestia megaterium]|nr:gallidermin/nisin family lantibiotic [Priestia megaterium]MDC7783943.1 gallidermin/nisin family lantibiotic [Priestia megaterium]MDC7783944.1 gallidermin/nisin family lantibiotic [Priestia megaterium]MDC7783945.1 gallidermin/nisin family lantibiotic [Priestia megaterium]